MKRPILDMVRAGMAALALGLAAPVAAQDGPDPEAAEALRARGFAIGDMVLGAADAPVTIIEYTSFTCPFCGNFHNETWPEIMERYVETGQVRLVFREVYFDQLGLWASMVARCGGPDTFFDKVDAIMERQAEWLRAENPVAELQRIGRLAGLSAERLQACLTDEPFMLQLVGDYQRNASADEIRSTPTFLINGERHSGFMPASAFAALIEPHL